MKQRFYQNLLDMRMSSKLHELRPICICKSSRLQNHPAERRAYRLHIRFIFSLKLNHERYELSESSHYRSILWERLYLVRVRQVNGAEKENAWLDSVHIFNGVEYLHGIFIARLRSGPLCPPAPAMK